MILELILLLVLLAMFVIVAKRTFFSPIEDPGADAQVYVKPLENGKSESAKPALRRQLRILKLDIEPLVFVLGSLLFGALVFLLFLEIFPDMYLFATLAGVAMMVFAFSLLRSLSRWRARRFEELLVDALELMHAALQGGENPMQALAVTAEASTGIVKTELVEVVKRLELGLSIEKATARMADMYDSDGVRLFTQVLITKWHAGGDLGMLLRSVSRIIRERVKLRMRISGQLAGARYASVFVALLPYLVIPVFLWKQPLWLDTLTQHPLGPGLLLGAVLLQVIGFFWLSRILRTDT